MNQAQLNYLDPSIESSLYRTGQLRIRRDRDGSDSAFEGVVLSRERVTLNDGRRSGGCHLDREGFALRPDPLDDPKLDFLSADPVIHNYYETCAERVASECGANHVFAFDHNVRSAAGKEARERLQQGQEIQGPARVVHGDYTLTSAPDRLRQLAEPPRENDTYARVLSPGETLVPPTLALHALNEGRYAFINLWRNIDDSPVETDPIVLCDARSVTPKDLAVFELHYSDRIGENYFSKPDPGHRWFIFPNAERDEALFIKQWDSAGPLARSGGTESDADEPNAPCTFSFHTAYFDPATMTGGRPRWSIEVRCLAIWD